MLHTLWNSWVSPFVCANCNMHANANGKWVSKSTKWANEMWMWMWSMCIVQVYIVLLLRTNLSGTYSESDKIWWSYCGCVNSDACVKQHYHLQRSWNQLNSIDLKVNLGKHCDIFRTNATCHAVDVTLLRACQMINNSIGKFRNNWFGLCVGTCKSIACHLFRDAKTDSIQGILR